MSVLRETIKRELLGDDTHIVEFCESSDYCNKPLYPLQRVLLKFIFLEEMEGWEEDLLSWMIAGGRGNEILVSPHLRERRDWCREQGYQHFTEVDLVGGRRSSKGHITGLAGAYKLWKTRQIPDPAAHFGMDIDRQIEFSCIAASFDQAKTRQFADFYSSINRCKAMQPYIAKRQEEMITVRADSDIDLIKELQRSGANIQKDFAKFRILPLAANADTLRGSASIFLVFDEMAFMMPGESRSSASECYQAAEPSLAQFGPNAMVFCNPPEAPIWMADLSFKPLGEIQVGDKVTGWQMEGKTRSLCESTVTNVIRRTAPLVRVTMKSGRVLRCTPDHRWLTPSYGGKEGYYKTGEEWFTTPAVGKKVIRVIDETPELTEDLKEAAAWMGGIFDGEGFAKAGQAIQIGQSKSHNPDVFDRIEAVLEMLGIEFTSYDDRICLRGDRQMVTNFANWTNPVRRRKLIEKALTKRWRTIDEIVAVEPDGDGEVISLSTTTVNYVAWGYASRNCNSSPYTRIGQFYIQFMQAMQAKDHRDGWYQMRFAIQWPSWSLYDKWWTDPTRKWSNAIMVSPDWEDQIEPDVPESRLDTKNLTMREAEKLKEIAQPDSYRVEYRGQWAEVLDAYLKPEMVDRVFNGIKPDGEICARSFGGTYKYQYLAHCDPSSTTAGFGFALGHVEEFEDQTGLFPDGVARHVVFDLVKRWNPQDFPGGTINYIGVRKEIAHFMNLYRPNAITFDQYNSVGLIQELREDANKMGIRETRIGEVKATQAVNWNRWEAFKTAVYLGLVHIPPDCIEDGAYGLFDHSEYAKQELKFLQEVQTGQTRRVDKQELGPIQTKDIADCIAEVTVKFLGSYVGDFMSNNFDQKVAMGAEGGFQIGGRQEGGPMNGMGMPSERGRGSSHAAFDQFYGGQRGSSNDPSAARGIFRRGRQRG